MMTKLVLALASTAIAFVNAKIYFQEDFNTPDWNTRWIQSEWKPSNEVGAFKQINGKYWKNEADKALQTSEDARFYALTATFKDIFDNKNKDLFLSYLVQHEQKLDCGGAYIKLLPSTTDPKKFGGDSAYNIMFGPDICGSTRKTHAILNYARPGKESVNMDHQTEIRAESDSEPHLYSFIIRKDNTYDVKIDGKSIKSGQLNENWPFQPEKEIKDPKQSKPKDWVDDKMMPDPADIKPANWDDVPKTIPDPEAKKPEDWDDEDDGDWEPAMIDNPEYKGEWQPKLINNPDYKGPWEHPLIPNPEYFEDEELYHIAPSVGAIGFELWQVKSGTLFDDILVTDEEETFTTHETNIMKKIKEVKDNKEEMETLERQKEEAEAKKEEEAEAKKEDEEEGKEGKDGDKEEEDEEAVVEDDKVDEKDEL